MHRVVSSTVLMLWLGCADPQPAVLPLVEWQIAATQVTEYATLNPLGLFLAAEHLIHPEVVMQVRLEVYPCGHLIWPAIPDVRGYYTAGRVVITACNNWPEILAHEFVHRRLELATGDGDAVHGARFQQALDDDIRQLEEILGWTIR